MAGAERRYAMYSIGNGIVDQQVKMTDSAVVRRRVTASIIRGLPPDWPPALRYEDRTRNLCLPLVPLGFLTRLIHLCQREFVGNKRVEGELVAVPYQIV